MMTFCATASAQLPPPVPLPLPIPRPGGGSAPAPQPYGVNDAGGFRNVLPPGQACFDSCPSGRLARSPNR